MATQKGTHITDFDSNPPDVVPSRKHGGVLKYAGDQFELAIAGAGDIAHVLKVPIDALLHSIKFASDDLGTTGTVDIGFYTKDADGTYSAVDQDAIANNIDVNTAAVALTEYRYSIKGIETKNQTAWELAGLAARPAYGDLYLSFTMDTATTAAGTVLLECTYTE
jgi:hypothetical protein